MKSALPWIIATMACCLAAWSWLQSRPADVHSPASADGGLPSRPTPAATETKGGESSTSASARAPKLRATQACLAQLQAARSALVRCRPAAGLETPEQPACLDDPEVVRVVERRIEDAISDHVEDQQERRRRARERERSAFSRWATDALALTAEEEQWLEDYVCAARQLREETLASLDETPPTEALEQLKQQRGEVLEDMKQALGPERYAKLRAIGGIGLLADTTDCP